MQLLDRRGLELVSAPDRRVRAQLRKEDLPAPVAPDFFDALDRLRDELSEREPRLALSSTRVRLIQ